MRYKATSIVRRLALCLLMLSLLPSFGQTGIQTQEVKIESGDAVLAGTLTLPEEGDENTPVVVMITGSGLQNRDEEVFGHKPFAEIAEFLAANGVASLRCDDRGFGESTGSVDDATTATFTDDTRAQIEYLRSRFKRIGALGHSEGARIALALGAAKDVDFVIGIGCQGVRGDSVLVDQSRVALTEKYIPQEYIDRYCTALARLYEIHNAGGFMLPPDALVATLTVEWGANDMYNQGLKQNLAAVAKLLRENAWFSYFVKDSPYQDIVSCSVPTMIIMGEKDTQISPELNLPGLRANPAFQIEVLPGLNHLMLPCATGSVAEYAIIKAPFSPTPLALILKFISPQN